MAKLFNSLSKSSSKPTACIIMTSTLSGENFSLKRDNVWAKPSDMALSWCSSTPSMRVVKCILIPRMISLTFSLSTEMSMPSFLLMLTPKGLSSTAKLSAMPASTMFFLRNFLRLLPSAPSVSSVHASIASLVSLNLWNAATLTCLAASSLVLNKSWIESASALSNFLFFTVNNAKPAGVSNNSNILLLCARLAERCKSAPQQRI
mmetsp:Transcript_27170/g.78062  ORF Transcript_27170/g.78062 Transcript_27170/m.78062 type:complete len:205 (+) Transcript_27170:1018-1632(+)